MSADPADQAAPMGVTMSNVGQHVLEAMVEQITREHGPAAALQAMLGATAYGAGFVAAGFGVDTSRSLLLVVLEGCRQIDPQAAAQQAAEAIRKAGSHG